MGPVFTSPVAPAGLCVCWAVTGSTNNALTTLSNLNHIDTSSGVAHYLVGKGSVTGQIRVNCLSGYMENMLFTGGQVNGLCSGSRSAGVHLCECVYVSIYANTH